jgi:hypothetical protein
MFYNFLKKCRKIRENERKKIQKGKNKRKSSLKEKNLKNEKNKIKYFCKPSHATDNFYIFAKK